MRKLISLFVILAFLQSCGGNTDKKEPEVADITKHPDYQKGLELISKDNCFTCHKIEEKFTGPAYRDIANKYVSDDDVVDDLAEKIRKGTVGVWGTIPMPARADISEENAKAMVRYILLLKK